MTLFPKEDGDNALTLRICMLGDTTCRRLLLKPDACHAYLLKRQ